MRKNAPMSRRQSWSQSQRDAFNTSWRRWYASNAKRKLGWQQRRLEEIRAWWRELKATKACEHCGETAPECLHFHHVDPATKKFNLSNAASGGRSRHAILAELDKCIVLCANCHFKHHWDERH